MIEEAPKDKLSQGPLNSTDGAEYLYTYALEPELAGSGSMPRRTIQGTAHTYAPPLWSHIFFIIKELGNNEPGAR